jgi:chromosome segregation ATPase
MDPAFGGIVGTSLVAVIAGWFALRQTRTVTQEQARANQNTQAMETVKVQIDGWDRLTDSYRTEIGRLTEALVTERATTARLREERRELRRRLEHCRTHHSEEPTDLD